MKNVFRWFAPVLVLALGVGFLFFNDYYLKPNLNTTEIVVASEQIDFTDKITKEHLSIQKINRDNVVEGAFTVEELNMVLDERASITIPKGTQLHSGLIDSYELVPNGEEGEFIAPIPESWLYAVAGTMRRGYVADFYIVGSSESSTIERLLKDAEEISHEEESESEEDLSDVESIQNELDEETEQEVNEIIEKLREPILQNVRVASVRDRSNSEVVSTDEQTDNGTGSIANLEIIADREMLDTMQDYIDEGYKLYVVYRYDIAEHSEENQDTEDGE